MTLRVVQWATGGMGRAPIEAILLHPDLELVGVRAMTDVVASSPSQPTRRQSGTVILYHYLKELGMSVTASEARKQLFPLIEKVNNDRVAVEITSRRGNAVLVSADEYAALEETAYLLRVPANAKRLLESLQQAKSGDRHEHELAE
jgi:antitoxin YefM